jgi:TldD protein
MATAAIGAWHTEKRFLNSRGADLTQRVVEVEGSLRATAQDDSGYTYSRSMTNMHQAGWEFIDAMRLREAASALGREAGELVVAPWAPEGRQTVVLGADLVALIIHESCGHPTELDRVLGWEAAFAGTSFLLPEMLGAYRYGSPHVTIVADSTTPGGLGTYGWDDEGTPAQRWDLVSRGIFTGYLSNRESAPAIGQASHGCGRASGWNRMPIVRMVNVSLEPARGTLDDLIGGIDAGIYVDTPSSWSLDDKRMNFHFSAELCREIRHGALGAYRKGAAFQARTPEFWGAVQAVGGPEAWRLRGFASCAKGEPLQLAHVAHGAAPIIVTGLDIARE